MSLIRDNIDTQKLPQHVAIIMDGNGRWARKRGGLRILGHRSAIKAVRDTIEGAAEIGLKYVTLYAFSTENWNRPQAEVNALMELLVNTIKKETPTLMKNRIRLRAIGNLGDLPPNCQNNLAESMEVTSANDHMTLTLALSYGGRWDMLAAIRKLATKAVQGEISPEDIDENLLRQHMSTGFLPDPELLIRTSGEFRISNFLLWEIAYAEIYITQKLWPDFRREDLFEAILNYQGRERRFGKTSEQITA
ncbi:MAG: isoprenyl transferase [Bacteroidia bacterium]|nr:isoprenyl transferase [Bacteroidia bacterium]